MTVKFKVINHFTDKIFNLQNAEQNWQTLTASEDLYQSAINWLMQI